MSYSHTINLGVTTPGNRVTGTITETGDGEERRDIPLTALQANKEVALVLEVAAIKSLFMLATGGCTIKTNSSSAPDDTITLAAGQPLAWSPSMSFDNPLTADVTALFITDTSDDPNRVQIEVLLDSTP